MLIRIGTLFALLAVLTLTAYAQDLPLKIGYIDANRVVSEAPQGSQALKELQEEFAVREEQLRSMQIEMIDVQDKLEKAEESDLSRSEVRNLETNLRRLQRDLDRRSEELNEDFNYRRNQELEQLQTKISDLILQMASEQQFDLIVQSPVVWASERIDITDEVLEELQRMFQSE